ncbi:MAG TPA: hypothetical protein VHA33_20990 [Candidatus Angelobacter sp.]|jgi:ribosomal protein S27AE|nr:hypothetical protein [Candidatus Angelobacter sp.]
MATFTPEQNERIVQKLVEKIGTNKACPMCGRSGWLVNDGLVLLTLQSPAQAAITIGGKALPSLTITCTTCGNTVFLNVFTLGLGDVLGMVPAPPEGGK